MLILTRKPGESLYIGDNIKITVVELKGNQIRVGIDAPSDLRIYREEIYLQILEENKKAAEAAMSPEAGLEGLSQAWQERLGDTGAPAAKGEKKGLASMRSVKVAPEQAPSVIIKRKKSRPSDE